MNLSTNSFHFIATQDFGCDTSHSDCHLYRFCAVASGFELLGGGGRRRAAEVGSWMDGGRRQIMFGGRSIGGNLELLEESYFPPNPRIAVSRQLHYAGGKRVWRYSGDERWREENCPDDDERRRTTTTADDWMDDDNDNDGDSRRPLVPPPIPSLNLVPSNCTS